MCIEPANRPLHKEKAPANYLSISLSIYLSIDLSIYPSVHLCIHQSIYFCIYLSIYISILRSFLGRSKHVMTNGTVWEVAESNHRGPTKGRLA